MRPNAGIHALPDRKYELYNYAAYVLKQLKSRATDWHCTVASRWIRHTVKLHLRLTAIWRWWISVPTPFALSRNRRSNDVWRSDENRNPEWNNHPVNAIIRTHKSHNYSVPLRVTMWRICCTCQLHLQLQAVKDCANAICTGPRSKVTKYGEEKRRNRRQKHLIDYFPPVPSSKTLLTHFLHSQVSDLNSSVPSAPTSGSIQLVIQYHTRRSYHLVVGICRHPQGGRASTHDLLLMGPSAAGIGCRHQSYTAMGCSFFHS